MVLILRENSRIPSNHGLGLDDDECAAPGMSSVEIVAAIILRELNLRSRSKACETRTDSLGYFADRSQCCANKRQPAIDAS